MLVGDDVSGRIDNEAGAKTLQCLSYLPRPAPVIAEKLRVKVVKWIPHGAADNALGIDVNYRRQNLGDRQDRRLRCRVSLGKQRVGKCERDAKNEYRPGAG